MSITNIVTYKTKEYGMFKSITGNRDISERNVKGIMKNIRDHGLKPTIVIVNENMEVIDGQHRIEALKRLNLPVYYQIHKGLTLEDCIAMNTSATVWNCKDYIDSYAEIGNSNYVELKRLSALYPEFTPNNIVAILNNKTTTRVGQIELDYTGSEAESRLNYISAIYKTLKSFTGRKDCLFVVLARVMDLQCIDKRRLHEQMLKYGYLLSDIVDIKSCLLKVEEVYNYRKSVKVRFISQYYEKYEDTYRPRN